MPRGGTRPGAGRPKKPAAQKILEGNPGRRPIEILDFGEQQKSLPAKPEQLTPKAEAIYKDVCAWLEKVGCTNGIYPGLIEDYARCKAEWLECESKNTTHGILVKDQNGKPMLSPLVGAAHQYLKAANEAWQMIYAVIRESKLSRWEESDPNDDVMEKLLKIKM